MGLCALAVLLTACAEQRVGVQLDNFVKKIFEPRRTPQQYMLVAVSDNDPDLRRKAVAKVAESDQSDQEWAIKGYIAIALVEDDPQTRCGAIRGLAQTGDPRATETMLKLLEYEKYPTQVQPTDTLSRWDATAALADLSARDQVPEDQRSEVRRVLLDRLRNDTDRHVRIAAARGLGYYAYEECVGARISGLRDRDFAVAHECESALVRLTGRTHDCDALAWSEWFEANRDNLFAAAGEVPETRRPKYTSRLGKFAYDTKQFFRWLYPGRKEK